MAGGCSLADGIRRSPALCLGLRTDRTRHTRAVAPPTRLVVVEFYRYVRNPMYVGSAAGWIGLWVVFGQANPIAIASVLAVALAVHLFVIFYEEPVLREKFGGDYDDCCRNVSRWWPRLRGWDKQQ
jgi:protein-S-isoprenylcysteine O-methyltransferase Ste14